MSNFNVRFGNPWLLLLLIPAIILALIPYLRLPKNRRRTRNRVVSMIIHTICLALAVLLLAETTFHIEEVLTSFDAVFVVDVSASNETAKEDMDEYLRTVLEEENADDFRIGIVTFANGQVTVSKLDDNPDKVFDSYVEVSDTPATDCTDVASALYYAKDLLKELKNSRLILLSDGLVTDGNAQAAARAIAEEGVRVDAVHFAPEGIKTEIQISSVTVNEEAAAIGQAELTVTLKSTASGAVKLILRDNGKKLSEQVVNVSGGTDTVSLSEALDGAGVHELTVELEADGDTLTQNNVFYTYVNRSSDSKVLLISNSSTESADLEKVLKNECDLDVIRPANAPADQNQLKKYSEIILMNISMTALPDGYDRILERFVEENGGGLFVIGGQSTLALGQMENTRMEELLPVTFDSDEKQVLELMIVMDISSSMDKTMTNSRLKRIEVAKDGAIESVKALRDSDFVGLVTFDENANLLVKLSPATMRDQVISRIEKIQIGFGTKYGNALTTAQSALFSSRNKADRQHVIFLTDGNPNDSDYESTIRSMASRGITVSTIAIFDEHDPDLGDINTLKARVQEMASIGGGRSYLVTDANELSTIMRTETELTQRKVVNEETVQPEVKDYSSVIQGVEKLPVINGYLGVGAKEGATVAYVVGDSPLYAEWQYGKGNVAVFTGALSGNWAGSFLRSGDGQIFVGNVVRKLSETRAALDIQFEEQNYTTAVRVQIPVEAGQTAKAFVTDPDGRDHVCELAVAGADGYTGSFDTKKPGVYQIRVNIYDEHGDYVDSGEACTAFSYSKEYDAFLDPQDGYNQLDAICKSAGGRILLPTEQVFEGDSLTVSRNIDPSISLIIAVICLFLLDIAVRKFNFKWPHEIIRERRERKS